MIEDADSMKSPITGGRMTLHREWRDIEFRKEKYHVIFPFFRCEDTGEQFTTTESDSVWTRQIHEQYCMKYGIPYVDEIVSLRESYGLSATKMSLILGFGENQYRKYEQEEVPNLSNGRMIRSAMNPTVFLDLVESSRGLLSDNEYKKIIKRLRELMADTETQKLRQHETRRIFGSGRSVMNGYAPLSLDRLKNTMLCILEQCGELWCTKMNKLLFYIDFLAYRNCGMAITGLAYRAIEFGPVPDRWERVYSEFDEIRQESRYMGDFEGAVLVATAKPDEKLFSKDELQVIRMVCERFKGCSSREISLVSHMEKGWIDCHELHKMIPFEDAIDLKAFE